MITFQYNNKRYKDVPEQYNELTGSQLINIADLITNKDLPKDVQQLEALRIVLGKTVVKFVAMADDVKARMLQYIEWVFEKNQLTEQLLPWYDGFVGPKGEFDNLTLAEFHFSEQYYRQHVVDEEAEALNSLIAVLYRKEKPGYDYELDSDGDGRVKFNANEVNYYASVIKQWPAKLKAAVLFFYDGCRQNLLESYDEVFQGDSGKENESGMFGVIRGLSGDKYGDMDKVEQLNIHTALLELSIQIKEAAEIEARMPSTK